MQSPEAQSSARPLAQTMMSNLRLDSPGLQEPMTSQSVAAAHFASVSGNVSPTSARHVTPTRHVAPTHPSHSPEFIFKQTLLVEEPGAMPMEFVNAEAGPSRLPAGLSPELPRTPLFFPDMEEDL